MKKSHWLLAALVVTSVYATDPLEVQDGAEMAKLVRKHAEFMAIAPTNLGVTATVELAEINKQTLHMLRVLESVGEDKKQQTHRTLWFFLDGETVMVYEYDWVEHGLMNFVATNSVTFYRQGSNWASTVSGESPGTNVVSRGERMYKKVREAYSF